MLATLLATKCNSIDNTKLVVKQPSESLVRLAGSPSSAFQPSDHLLVMPSYSVGIGIGEAGWLEKQQSSSEVAPERYIMVMRS